MTRYVTIKMAFTATAAKTPEDQLDKPNFSRLPHGSVWLTSRLKQLELLISQESFKQCRMALL